MTDEALFRVHVPGGASYGPADRAMLLIWASEGRLPLDAELVPEGGGPPIALRDDEELARRASAPPTVRPAGASQAPPIGFGADPTYTPGDGSDAMMSTVIPFKNPPALIAYYLGLAALLPFVGIVIGIAAFVLGIIGLRIRAREPHRKGSVHAWIGIIAGGGLALIWAVVLVLIGVSA